MHKKTHSLILSGVFIALGLVLPIAFHMFGGAGPIFLPMHIPVLIGGFFLSPMLALSVGVLTPMLSGIITGMPPIFPMMPIMMLELGIYGLTISVVKNNVTKNPYIALLASMILGRVAAGFMVFVLSTFFAAKLPSAIIFITTSVTTGIPGIIIQLIIIPIVVIALNKSNLAVFEGAK
ncbi:MAG: ECF transporter S component [Clostridiales bacterium]|nr:ECF transporter S component [Clostridiales bacterium]